MSLVLTGVSRAFAGVLAVDDVSVRVEPGSAVALIGPNGAGKTSVVNLASGLVRPDSGRVVVDEHDLTGRSPRQFAAAGVVRTFQSLRLFESMTVAENVLVGAYGARRLPLLAALLRTPRFRRQERALAGTVDEALDAVALRDKAHRPVAELSHGQRRRVELARALAARPSYLVLDEPGAGLDPAALDDLATLLAGQLSAGLGLLVVEHDAGLVERIADTVVAVVQGRVVASGSYDEVRRHPDIAAQS
jgi:ABC-type branched-subunit amino acid transport system ATPase component